MTNTNKNKTKKKHLSGQKLISTTLETSLSLSLVYIYCFLVPLQLKNILDFLFYFHYSKNISIYFNIEIINIKK